MSVLHRQVRHLRLAATRDEHVRHGRVLCEDALRTATIDDQARLIIVRRLELGAVPATASATGWSQRIELTLGRLPGGLVRADSPLAARAAVVFFPSAEEAWHLLAVRSALGQAVTGWFWPVALPGWNKQTSARENLRLAFRTLAARPDGLRHTLQLAQRLAAVRAWPTLLQALEPADLNDLAPVLTALPPLRSALVDDASVHFAATSRIEETVFAAAARLVSEWPPDDLRARWVASYLAVPAPTASSATSQLLPPEPDATRVAAILSRLHEQALRLNPATLPQPESTGRVLSPPARAEPTAPKATPAVTPAPTPEAAPEEPSFIPDREPTAAGGLFFLIRLLERAQLVARLEKLPTAQRTHFVAQVFQLALRHARIPALDPIRQFIPADLPETPFDLQDSAYVFLLRANRQGRALCGLGLREIIARPALLTMTSTHADLFFKNQEADVRLRRAGLDLDPGWVRWLGRVVTYHYNRTA